MPTPTSDLVRKNTSLPAPPAELTREHIITDPAMRANWVHFQLKLHGSSFAILARKLGVTRPAVRNALFVRYPKMERAIAKEIGMKPEQIWPERYSAAALK
ncbi:MAG: helix-turn-helix domain-containing protein [Desulfuromonadaceae bacterium]|nr:helix-turn-helix domain-containing protein [Desulfuromonadaceae bacterium]